MFDAINESTKSAKPEPSVQASRLSVERVAEAKLPTEMGEFRLIGYRSLTSDEEFVVLGRGEFAPDEPILARIHSQCLTGDVFGSTKCDCGQQLHTTMRMIADAGRGAIIYTTARRTRHRYNQQNSSLRTSGRGLRHDPGK